MSTDTQAQALLQGVTDDRDRRRAALRTAAESQAQQIVRSARAQARRSVHDAVTQERARMEFGLRQAAARADIEVRRQEQQTSRELLGQMWTAIAAVLTRRWQDPAPRAEWIEAALGQAGKLLAGRAWCIESSADWTPPERAALTAQARSQGASAVTVAQQGTLPAGLKIHAERVCVDATVAGLLAQRGAIEAAFLAEYLPVIEKSATEQRTDG
jgi:F0F1-type ATP synthase membrane subunit b/b'